MNSFILNQEKLPEIKRSGQFDLINPVYEFTYRSPTSAIHLYEYQGSVRIGNNEYPFQPGDITLTPAGMISAYQSATPGQHWVTHFRTIPCDTGYKIPLYLNSGSHSLFFLEQMKMITQLFNHNRRNNEKNRGFKLEAESRLQALLLSLYNLPHSHSPKVQTQQLKWSEIVSKIDENLAAPPINEEFARIMGISTDTFIRKFKKEFNMTVSQYLLSRRIHKAKNLLSTTVLSIKEIGEIIGVADPQYFNKQFRKKTNISPTSYREKNRTVYLVEKDPSLSIIDGEWEE